MGMALMVLVSMLAIVAAGVIAAALRNGLTDPLASGDTLVQRAGEQRLRRVGPTERRERLGDRVG